MLGIGLGILLSGVLGVCLAETGRGRVCCGAAAGLGIVMTLTALPAFMSTWWAVAFSKARDAEGDGLGNWAERLPTW